MIFTFNPNGVFFVSYLFFFQCKLELHHVGGTVDHATAFGRIAFSCPREQVK